MRVDAKITVSTSGVSSRRRVGSGFSLEAEPETRATGGTSSATHLGGIDALLVLQAEDDPRRRRRKQVKRGQDLLEALDGLKAALLAGRLGPGDLDRLRGVLIQRRETTDDPRLDDILAHIELRAAVELAKLQRR